MHRNRIKSLLALSLCAVLTSQNVMLIANAEEVNKNLENEVTIIPSDELQLESQENDLRTEEATSENINSEEKSNIEDIEITEELTNENSETTLDEFTYINSFFNWL